MTERGAGFEGRRGKKPKKLVNLYLAGLVERSGEDDYGNSENFMVLHQLRQRESQVDGSLPGVR